MVYDVSIYQPIWQTQPGHTETIFCCSFSRNDPNLLATCSFDSTVRVWDVSSVSCVKTLTCLANTTGSETSGNDDVYVVGLGKLLRESRSVNWLVLHVREG